MLRFYAVLHTSSTTQTNPKGSASAFNRHSWWLESCLRTQETPSSLPRVPLSEQQQPHFYPYIHVAGLNNLTNRDLLCPCLPNLFITIKQTVIIHAHIGIIWKTSPAWNIPSLSEYVMSQSQCSLGSWFQYKSLLSASGGPLYALYPLLCWIVLLIIGPPPDSVAALNRLPSTLEILDFPQNSSLSVLIYWWTVTA